MRASSTLITINLDDRETLDDHKSSMVGISQDPFRALDWVPRSTQKRSPPSYGGVAHLIADILFRN